MGLLDLFRRKKNINKSREFSEKNVEHDSYKEKISVTAQSHFNTELPSLSKLIEDSFPTENGLYPHEILMLHYAPTYKIHSNTFQSFWLYTYGVDDPQSIIDSLCRKGFITVGSIEDTLKNLTVKSLKEELANINVKTSGKKSDLIARLLESDSISFLEKKFPDRYYKLTEKGSYEIKTNEYVAYLHRNPYMSIWNMNKALRGHKESLSYRDILWGEFNRQSMEHFKHLDFGLYRNTRLSMYKFLMEEKKYNTACHLLCEVLYYDLSGLGNNESMLFSSNKRDRKFRLSLILENHSSNTGLLDSIPPGIKDWATGIQSLLKLNNTEFEAYILNEFKNLKLPYQIYTAEECTEIVMLELKGTPSKIRSICKRARQRIQEEYDSL